MFLYITLNNVNTSTRKKSADKIMPKIRTFFRDPVLNYTEYVQRMHSRCSKTYSMSILRSTHLVNLHPSYTCTVAGVPHIVVQILQILDEKSLSMSEQVSNIWKDIIADLCMWKRLIQHKIDNNPLWRNLFKRRGW